MLSRKFKILSTLIVMTVASACASGPTYQEHAAAMQAVSGDEGRIYIYRIATMGTAVQPKVKINGEAVGKAIPKGFFYVDLPPGDYVISASTEAKRDLNVTLDSGEEKYVRLEMKIGVFAGHVKPVLVDTEEGKEEIQKTKYTGGGI